MKETAGLFADLALMILAPIIAILIQLAISRSREFGADKGGAEISGKPLALASALGKLAAGNARAPMRKRRLCIGSYVYCESIEKRRAK